MTITKTKKNLTFKAYGYVYGKYWGGGEGAYPSTVISADTKKELIETAKKGLDGSLDGGMGYEKLIGAILLIEKITTIEVDGETYEKKDSEIVFIGELTQQQKHFLNKVLFES